jgi:ribosomal protein L37E
MTRCHRSHLESRCAERGYALEEVLPCVVAQDGDEWTIDVDHPAFPRTPRPGFERQSTHDLARHDAPSFLAKVKNFATATAGHVAAGMPMATDDEIIRRHDICLQCEHLQDNACSLCGCPVARTRGYVSKLSWADQECPAGKWGKQVR